MKCLNCEKILIRRQKKYCSFHCQIEYQNNQKIKNWINGDWDGFMGKKVIEIASTIKNYLLKNSKFQCEKCGWNKINQYTNKVPLEIHHKDGNYLNNRPKNLIVICPNCHSLTENFKARGKGREYRNK